MATGDPGHNPHAFTAHERAHGRSYGHDRQGRPHKTTPRPSPGWTVKEMAGGFDVVDPRGRFIAACGGGGDLANPDAEAHAHLFAAAPDLLAVLKEITEHVTKYGGFPRSADLLLGRAMAAIAKASPET